MSTSDPGGQWTGVNVSGNRVERNLTVVGGHHNNVTTIVQESAAAYRIEEFDPRAERWEAPGQAPDPEHTALTARRPLANPSTLLEARHAVVPFTGRRKQFDRLKKWLTGEPKPHSDGLDGRTRVLLLHGPGGRGKSRLAAEFAEASSELGWTVWRAVEDVLPTAAPDLPPAGPIGVLLVVDNAERLPAKDLQRLLADRALHGSPRLRVLLVSRPAGPWWTEVASWVGRYLHASAARFELPPLAADPADRAALFRQACESFATVLGLPVEQAGRIDPPATLTSDPDYAQVLTVHLAALVAVDAARRGADAPAGPRAASAYLLDREFDYWATLFKRLGPTATPASTMARVAFTAALTGPLARPDAVLALQRVGLADTLAAATVLLDHYELCYPSRRNLVLEPLSPDHLREDLIGRTVAPVGTAVGLFAERYGEDGFVEEGFVEDGFVEEDGSGGLVGPAGSHLSELAGSWASHAVRLLLVADDDQPAPWSRSALTVLVESAGRWPHLATDVLSPLLTAEPQLLLRGSSAALIGLTELHVLRLLDRDLLDAVDRVLPDTRHTDLDAGAAALAAHLAPGRVAATTDLAIHAEVYARLSRRLSDAGRHEEAVEAAEKALAARRTRAALDPAAEAPALAAALSSLGHRYAQVGNWPEAVAHTEEAVAMRRELVATDPARYEGGLAVSLTNLGDEYERAGRWPEALAATEEAVAVRRRLLARATAAGTPDRESPAEAGTEVRTRAASETLAGAGNEIAAETVTEISADLALALGNLAALLGRTADRGEPERWAEAEAAAEEAVRIGRAPAAAQPFRYEPDLARALGNCGAIIAMAARHAGTDRDAQAIRHTREAVDVQQRLSEQDLRTNGPLLLTLLGHLRFHHVTLGQDDKAAAVAEDEAFLRRRLAHLVPAGLLPELPADPDRPALPFALHLGTRAELVAVPALLLGAWWFSEEFDRHPGTTRGRDDRPDTDRPAPRSSRPVPDGSTTSAESPGSDGPSATVGHVPGGGSWWGAPVRLVRGAPAVARQLAVSPGPTSEQFAPMVKGAAAALTALVVALGASLGGDAPHNGHPGTAPPPRATRTLSPTPGGTAGSDPSSTASPSGAPPTGSPTGDPVPSGPPTSLPPGDGPPDGGGPGGGGSSGGGVPSQPSGGNGGTSGGGTTGGGGTGGPSDGRAHWGYAYVNLASASEAPLGVPTELAPSWQWSTDAAGAEATVTRTATGDYQVRLPGLASTTGIAHATAYRINTRGRTCTVAEYGPSGRDELVRVRCFDENGAPIDWWHTVFFTASTGGGRPYATVRYDAPGGATALNPVANSGTVNSAGGTVRVLHDGTGRYRVLLAGAAFAPNTGHVQITPYGTGTPVHCQPDQTATQGGALVVPVTCWAIGSSPVAQPADSQWLLSYVDGEGLHGDPSVPAANAASTSADPSNQTLDTAHSYSADGTRPTITRLGPGNYRLTWTTGGTYGGNVQVSANGGSGYCMLGWIGDYQTLPVVRIDVDCLNPAGVPTDGAFTLSYVRRP
ncbi:tetratricopeptide repeat protein [Kitasatospora sp. NPDC049285]|uniref:tetratricopeptide repeat protein n=1 Tax=Kitasatospora sp. NPDC049285 TaxID=3157096 RepID=UPI0034333566